MVGVEYSEASVEVLKILNFLDEDEIKKIPNEIIRFLEENKSKTYNPNIKFEENIDKLELKNKTREILGGIYLDYLCNNEEKEAFMKKVRENQMQHEQKLREDYGEFDVFKKRQTNDNAPEKQVIVIENESFFSRIIKKIKKIFKLQ